MLLLAVVIAIVAMSISKTGTGGNGAINSSDQGKTGTRTIMVYMIGSDLESLQGAATDDLEEIERSGINLRDNNVLVYASGARHWQNGFTNGTTYQLTDSGFQEVDSSNSGSFNQPRTLSGFLSYAYNNFKTDLYDLFFWDHGNGPIIGFGYDEQSEETMLLSEIDQALRTSPFSSNNKLELVGFDACLMGTIEVASTFDEYADWFIGSQEVEPAYGWDWSFLGNVNTDLDSTTLARGIIDSYLAFYINEGLDFYDLSLSLINLSKLADAENSLSDLFSSVSASLDRGDFSSIANAMTQGRCFQCDEYDNSFDLVDLYSAVGNLRNAHSLEAASLLGKLDGLIAYQRTNMLGANGISIYYPYRTKSLVDQFLTLYDRINFSPEYRGFVRKAAGILTGSRLTDLDFKGKQLSLSKSPDGGRPTLSIDLGTKVLESYHQSRYIIFKDAGEGYYSPVFSSSDTTLSNDGVLSANLYQNEFNLINNDDGTKAPIIATEAERREGFVIYRSAALLTAFGESFANWQNKLVFFLIKVDDDNPKGIIVGVIPAANIEDPASTKESINLAEWDTIQFVNSKYKIFDTNGDYTWDWQNSESITGWEVPGDSSFSIELSDLENSSDYYCLFVITDTQGNTYTTDMVKV